MIAKKRLLDEDKMIIWKIRIAIDKMKIIIRLFDYSIDFRIIEYLMPKYANITRQRVAKGSNLHSDFFQTWSIVFYWHKNLESKV